MDVSEAGDVKVKLRAYCDDHEPDYLSSLLAIRPTSVARKGDLAPDGHHRVSRNGWWIDSDSSSSVFLDHWERTVGMVTPRSESVRSAASQGWEFELLVYLSAPPIESVVLTPEMLGVLSSMRITLCIVAS